jgi:hypothetical protein
MGCVGTISDGFEVDAKNFIEGLDRAIESVRKFAAGRGVDDYPRPLSPLRQRVFVGTERPGRQFSFYLIHGFTNSRRFGKSPAGTLKCVGIDGERSGDGPMVLRVTLLERSEGFDFETFDAKFRKIVRFKICPEANFGRILKGFREVRPEWEEKNRTTKALRHESGEE